MKKYYLGASILSISTAIVLGMTGCGGSGSDSGSNNATGTTTVSGTGSDGYLSGSTVCYDTNNSKTCDIGEPVTVTDENGSFSLTLTPTQLSAKAPFLIEGGIDIDSLTALKGRLRAPYDGETKINVTPLSNMAMHLVENNVSISEAYSKVAAALGLTPQEVKADPVALARDNNNTEVLKASMVLNSIVKMMADVDTNTTTDAIYSNLVTGIQNVADDTNTSNKGIAAIVSQAKTNLPSNLQKVADVATVIENNIEQAVDDSNDTKTAALISSEILNIVQQNVQTAIDSNATIDSDTLENNVSASIANIDPKTVAISNILNAYDINDANDTVITTIAGVFTDVNEITVDTLVALTELGGDAQTTIDTLKGSYKKEQIKSYALNLGKLLTDDQINIIADVTSSPVFTKDMSKADFAELLYNTGNAELMKISLELTNPSVLTNIEKAKQLFTDLRTQAMSVSDANGTGFADQESQGMSDAVNNIAADTDYLSSMLNNINDAVAQAIDTNQTTVSKTNGSRTLTVTNSDANGNVVWNYDINSTATDKTWSGSITYTDVDPDTFDPSNFSTLNAHITGDLPLGYTDPTDSGIDNSQSVDMTAAITKISGGASLNLSAEVSSNGDSLKLSNVNAEVNYDVNTTTKEPLPNYVKVNRLTVDATVGGYAINGDLTVNAYTQNQGAASKGFETTNYGSIVPVFMQCADSNQTINNPNNVIFSFNNKSYTPVDYVDAGSGSTVFTFIVDEKVEYSDVNNTDNYANIACSDNTQPDVFPDGEILYLSYDNTLNNSGWLPSDATFTGTISDTGSNVLETTLNVKWTNAATVDMESNDAIPTIDATLNGTLSMPNNAPMKINVTYSKRADDSNVVHATYAYDITAITVDTTLDTNLTGVVNISSATGIKAKINVTDGQINYTTSTLTDNAGTVIGTFEEREGVPVVKYEDGSFESLP